MARSRGKHNGFVAYLRFTENMLAPLRCTPCMMFGPPPSVNPNLPNLAIFCCIFEIGIIRTSLAVFLRSLAR